MQALLFEINGERFYFFKGTSHSVAAQVISVGFVKQHSDSHLDIYTHNDLPGMQFRIVTVSPNIKAHRVRDVIGFVKDKLEGQKPRKIYITV